LLNLGQCDTDHRMFCIDDIPASFVEQHRECCALFMNWQTETILANIAAFEVPLDSASWQRLVLLKQCHAVAYLSRFCLRAIDDSERVVAAAKMRV